MPSRVIVSLYLAIKFERRNHCEIWVFPFKLQSKCGIIAFMENVNFNSEKYRQELADDLKNMRKTPEGKDFAAGFLSKEKETEEYKVSHEEDSEQRRNFMREKALQSGDSKKILGGLLNLPIRNQEKTQERIDKASTLDEIKSVMESGWEKSESGHWITATDRNGADKWQQLALEELKKAGSVQDLLSVISKMPSDGAGTNPVATDFLSKYDSGMILLAKFDEEPIEHLAKDVLRIIQNDKISLVEFQEDTTPEDVLMTMSSFSSSGTSAAVNDFLKQYRATQVLMGKLDKRSVEDLANELFESMKKENS